MLSETVASRPNRKVVGWLEALPTEGLFVSVLSLGEFRKGVEKLPAGRRREALRGWLEHEIPEWFGPRLLPVDAAVADRWGRLSAGAGRTLPAIDGLLAATALRHELRLVTRNVRDFRGLGIEIIDPWA